MGLHISTLSEDSVTQETGCPVSGELLVPSVV